ncbi:hypothetical protein BKA82DRAFT_4213639 [Pisolithus tinctorius]|nr:hypothetical protein BKA82DRAFT_4213639 [Pisolithus tinctorius]
MSMRGVGRTRKECLTGETIQNVQKGTKNDCRNRGNGYFCHIANIDVDDKCAMQPGTQTRENSFLRRPRLEGGLRWAMPIAYAVVFLLSLVWGKYHFPEQRSRPSLYSETYDDRERSTIVGILPSLGVVSFRVSRKDRPDGVNKGGPNNVSSCEEVESIFCDVPVS